jgi:Rrf2 family protein
VRLTRTTRYAVGALLHLARDGDGKVKPSHEVGKAEGIPDFMLLKILKPLVSAGVLHSLKGTNGGYRLARPAAKVTLLEVVEACEGPLLLPDDPGAGVNGLWGRRMEGAFEEAAQAARKVLGKVTLADLAGKKGN